MITDSAANDEPVAMARASTRGIAAAIALSVAGVAAFSVLPLIVGAIAQLPALDEARAGYVASADLVGFAAAALAAVVWVGRIALRRAAIAGLALIVTGNLISLGAVGFVDLLGARLLAGAGAGAAYAVAMSTLARASNPDRAFGIMIAAQVAFQVVALFSLPRLIALWGIQAIFVALAGIAALALPGVGLLARVMHSQTHGTSLMPRAWRGWVGLGGVLLFSLNIGAVWAYLERMGVVAGLSSPDVGTVLAASLGVSVLGALGASWLSDRWGRRLPFAAAVGAQLLALALLSSNAGASAYVVGAALYSLIWAFAVPYLYSIVSSRDPTGQLIVSAPAAQAIGASLGPMLAALLLRGDSYFLVDGLAALALLGALACMIVATRST
jgi:predicted MFS family arabinose efflux permease